MTKPVTTEITSIPTTERAKSQAIASAQSIIQDVKKQFPEHSHYTATDVTRIIKDSKFHERNAKWLGIIFAIITIVSASLVFGHANLSLSQKLNLETVALVFGLSTLGCLAVYAGNRYAKNNHLKVERDKEIHEAAKETTPTKASLKALFEKAKNHLPRSLIDRFTALLNDPALQ